jgi:hypothetical protein
MQIHDRADRSVAVIVFAVLSLIPAIIPAIIELSSPGASGRVKEAFERIMKVHGRWITAALLLGAGAFVANNAWHDFPGREHADAPSAVTNAPAAPATAK